MARLYRGAFLPQHNFFRTKILLHDEEGGTFKGDGAGAVLRGVGVFPCHRLARREVGGDEIDDGFGARLAPFGLQPADGAVEGLLPEGDGPLGVAVHKDKGDDPHRRVHRVNDGGAAKLVHQVALRVHLAVGLCGKQQRKQQCRYDDNFFHHK